MNKDVIQAVLEEVLSKAGQAEENAGYSGSWSDGGASVERQKVAFYQNGLNGVIPAEWRKIYDKIEKKFRDKQDPEYETYQRLKEKFERQASK